MASLGGTQLKRIQSGRDHCFGGASLQRLASHIGRPRFNALARLASSALRSSVDSRPVTTACAAVAARPAAQQAPVELIPGQGSDTPFAAHAHNLLSPQQQAARDIYSELGFPTDFQNRFSLGHELGSGSFGTVFSATDKETGEPVAVKILPKDSSGSGTRARRGSGRAGRDIILNKVKKELDVLQRLQLSGNAVELIGTFEDRTCVYIVMEECRGGDLESLLEDYGPMAEADVARAMFEVLKTIAACHANNFYHGDIKPANFMLKDQPSKIGPHGPTFERTQPGHWLKAIDFGCTVYMEPGQPLQRKTGTPMFMAPEVFIGNYGLEADMWAAGMMMYQLLADRFPWWSTMEELHTTTLEAVMEAVIQKDIPMDYGPWKSLSQEGFDLIHSLLHRDAGSRLTAAQALQHPWFKKFGLGDVPLRTASNNVVPLGRGFSDTLRLRMAAAELSRARSRSTAGLSGLLDDMLDSHGNAAETNESLCATFA